MDGPAGITHCNAPLRKSCFPYVSLKHGSTSHQGRADTASVRNMNLIILAGVLAAILAAEAAMFASTPGQAISYQIGKLLIHDFLASAQRQKGSAFNLRAFHDFLWQNGNVPITLQRWEYLGLKDQLDAADRLH